MGACIVKAASCAFPRWPRGGVTRDRIKLGKLADIVRRSLGQLG